MWKAPEMEEMNITLTAGGWTSQKEEGYRGQNGATVVVEPEEDPTEEGYSQS